MVELDRRTKWTIGYPIEASYLDLQIYRLVAIFAASEVISSQETGNWVWLKENFEFPEACRLLVGLAAILRNQIDANPATVEQGLERYGASVGTLTPDIDQPAEQTVLKFRDACNKILHADSINPDVADAQNYPESAINAFVYLSGRLRGTQWKATLNIYEFAQCAHSLT